MEKGDHWGKKTSFPPPDDFNPQLDFTHSKIFLNKFQERRRQKRKTENLGRIDAALEFLSFEVPTIVAVSVCFGIWGAPRENTMTPTRIVAAVLLGQFSGNIVDRWWTPERARSILMGSKERSEQARELLRELESGGRSGSNSKGKNS
eukprot:GHVN01105740.1.p1 GENE.GHVN01105740.1~~GHVN01105740.1.p1  ORF type:complete len:148 (+),score=14.02 GHVN01105740.1:1077-1520(+)